MQYMRLYFHKKKQFEETFENPQRRKDKQMQSMDQMDQMDQNTEQRDLGKTTGDQMIETENREKSIKCNQCDFASSQAGDI